MSLLSQGVVPRQRPTQISISPSLQPPIEVFLSILGSGRHKLLIAHGLTLLTLNLRGWEVFPTPGALTHTRITWAPHKRCHKSRVSLRGPPCTHGVSGTPHGEVCNIDGLRLYKVMTATTWPYDNGNKAWTWFKEDPIMVVNKGFFPSCFFRLDSKKIAWIYPRNPWEVQSHN